MIYIMIGIVIMFFCIIAGMNITKHEAVNGDLQSGQGISQPVIQKNGQVIIARIDISYYVMNAKKAKNAVKNGINIFGKLEYEGITELRRIADKIDNLENNIIKLENDLKNKLSQVGEDLGVVIAQLHIKFGDKNDSSARENIIDSAYEETTDAKYNFEVSIKTIFSRRISRSTNFNTKINIENDRLTYKLSTKYENSDRWLEHLKRRYNSFTEGIEDIYVDDIVLIKYKVGFSFALCFFDVIAFLCAIFGILFPVIGQISFWGMISTGLEQTPINFNYMPSIIFVFITIFFISYFTCKCIEIKYKSDNGIKKIIFPISRTFFFSVPNSIKKQVNTLLEEIKEKNQNVNIKKDRLKWILIGYIIIISIIYVFVPVYLKQKYSQDNELSYNINNDLVYCDVSFDKGKVIDIINKSNANGNLISEYVFELTNSEKIKIEGYNKEYGKTYNICTENYYKKDTNQLFKVNYLVRDDSNVMRVFADNAEYIYDYIGNKMFKLNFLNNDNIIDFETKIYYREIGNANTLYNFINYGKNMLEITDDFDVKEFKRRNYENIEKIDTYISEYGVCYILKANYNEKVDYLMYIENKDRNNIAELDGILLNSRIDRNGFFENTKETTKSFKIICPEK